MIVHYSCSEIPSNSASLATSAPRSEVTVKAWRTFKFVSLLKPKSIEQLLYTDDGGIITIKQKLEDI